VQLGRRQGLERAAGPQVARRAAEHHPIPIDRLGEAPSAALAVRKCSTAAPSVSGPAGESSAHSLRAPGSGAHLSEESGAHLHGSGPPTRVRHPSLRRAKQRPQPVVVPAADWLGRKDSNLRSPDPESDAGSLAGARVALLGMNAQLTGGKPRTLASCCAIGPESGLPSGSQRYRSELQPPTLTHRSLFGWRSLKALSPFSLAPSLRLAGPTWSKPWTSRTTGTWGSAGRTV
jgi:hypothetical protein